MWVTDNYKGEQIWYSKEEYWELERRLKEREKTLSNVSEALLKALDGKLDLDKEEKRKVKEIIKEYINE